MERERKRHRDNSRVRRNGLIGLIFLVLLGFYVHDWVFQPYQRSAVDNHITDPLLRIHDMGELDKKTREAAMLFLRIAEDEGLEVIITETYRTKERQQHLYAQGRTRPGSIVTWTLNSRHTGRNAFDIAKNVRGEEYSDLEFFRKAAEIGRRIGLEAGYYWGDGKQDMPHFEMGRFSRIHYPEGYK